jgi:hypothetical protein
VYSGDTGNGMEVVVADVVLITNEKDNLTIIFYDPCQVSLTPNLIHHCGRSKKRLEIRLKISKSKPRTQNFPY